MNKKTKCKLLRFFGILFLLAGLGSAAYGVYSWITVEPSILCYILVGAGAVAVFLATILFASAKKTAKKICLKCGCDLHGCAYEWELDSIQDNVEQSTIQGDYYSTETMKYIITATCPHCGKERVYHKDFTSSNYGTRTYRNPNKLIEDWCKQQFGH